MIYDPKMRYDLVYSDVDECYIAIPHLGPQSIKEHYDRIYSGTSGLYASFRIDTGRVAQFIDEVEK